MGGRRGKDWRSKAPTSLDAQPLPPMSVLDNLGGLDTQERRGLATTLRQVSETFGEVPDGKTASHVLGVLALLLDPA